MVFFPVTILTSKIWTIRRKSLHSNLSHFSLLVPGKEKSEYIENALQGCKCSVKMHVAPNVRENARAL